MLTKTQLDTRYLANGARTTTEREYALYAIACHKRQGQDRMAQYYRDYLNDLDAQDHLA